MPDWILLLPILFPLVAAPICAPVALRFARTRAWLPLACLVLEIVLVLANIAPGSHRLVISTWESASFSLALQMEGVTLLLVLAMLVPLLALALIAPLRAPFDALRALVLVAALLLVTADGLVTAYCAWVLLDVTMFLWRTARDIEGATAARGLLIGQFAGLGLFAGITLLAGGRVPEGTLLCTIALWARLGLFPFHIVLPTSGADAHDLWFARGVPLLAATNLWLRGDALRVAAPVPLLGALTALALVVAAIWIWREPAPVRASLGVSQTFALVPLTLALGGDAGLALALWLALGAAFALALAETAQRWRAENRNRYPRVLWFAGILALAGLPLTPAFIARLGLYVVLWESGNGALVALASVAMLVTLAPLWNLGATLAGEARERTRGEFAGAVVLALAFLVLALAPMPLAHALGIGNAAERALARLVSPGDPMGVVVGIAALLVPIVGAFFLRHRAAAPARATRLARLARPFDLDWLERLATEVVYQMSAVARNASTIAEENPTVWILFAALWIAIFVMLAR